MLLNDPTLHVPRSLGLLCLALVRLETAANSGRRTGVMESSVSRLLVASHGKQKSSFNSIVHLLSWVPVVMDARPSSIIIKSVHPSSIIELYLHCSTAASPSRSSTSPGPSRTKPHRTKCWRHPGLVLHRSRTPSQRDSRPAPWLTRTQPRRCCRS